MFIYKYSAAQLKQGYNYVDLKIQCRPFQVRLKSCWYYAEVANLDLYLITHAVSTF